MPAKFMQRLGVVKGESVNRVSFLTKPLGPLAPPFREDHIVFLAGGLEVKAAGPVGLHGLAFAGPDLEILFEIEAASVSIDLIVFNSTEIRAFDAGGGLVAAPIIFAENAGTVGPSFTVGSPIIHRVVILSGELENLLLQVIAS